MKNIICFVFFMCTCIACKKTEVSGTVYTKHNIPLTGASIKLYDYVTGASMNTPPAITDAATTDNSGHYYFSFSSKRKHDYHIICENDSGRYGANIKTSEVNKIDLYLQ